MDVGTQNHVTAASAIAAVRPALGHKLLPSKTDRPPSAVPRLRKDFDSIDKHARIYAS